MSDEHDTTIGIDFGTGGYSIAIGYSGDTHSEPSVLVSETRYGTERKNTASVLCRRDGLKGVLIGQDADAEYAEMQKVQRDAHVLFDSAKMALYTAESQQGFDERTSQAMATALDGTHAPAVDVITEAMKLIRIQALTSVNEARGEDVDCDEHIQWVLTVPAIWSEASKSMMRSAAERAGIRSTALMLSLEPEAAAILCWRDAARQGRIDDAVSIGDRFMVIDAGAGTVDISVHELGSDRSLKQVAKPCGGPWGSRCIDEGFKRLLERAFGPDEIEEFREQAPDHWSSILRHFELQKCRNDLHHQETIRVELGSKICFMLENVQKVDGVMIDRTLEIMELSRAVFEALVQPSVTDIVSMTERLLDEVDDIKLIYLVGGFGACTQLKDPLTQLAAQRGARFVRPIDPRESVVKGAVLYGLNPKALSSRLMRSTIAVEVCSDWVEGIHDEHRKKMVDGKPMIVGLLDVLVQEGEQIDVGDTKSHLYRAMDNQDFSVVRLYSLDNTTDQFVGDAGVKLVGEILVGTPAVSSLCSRSLTVTLRFGGTEFAAEARGSDGSTVDCRLRLDSHSPRSRVSMTPSRGVVSADICFVMDCTGSMGVWIDAAKQQLVGIATSVQKQLRMLEDCVQLRFAFVAYRDFCDYSRLEVCSFTTNCNAVTSFIAKQHATGGGDGPEDLLGGLNAATALDWSSKNRFVVLVADAPCHGLDFSGNGSGDSYPDGNPDGLKAEAVLKSIESLRAQVIFTKLTSFTNLMIAKFSEIIPIRQVHLDNIDCISQFGRSLSSEIAGHIRRVS